MEWQEKELYLQLLYTSVPETRFHKKLCYLTLHRLTGFIAGDNKGESKVILR